MSLGTILVLLGTLLALLNIFFGSRVAYLLHVAVVLIGAGVLVGAAPLFHV